jgi:hypothetical protein
MENEAEALHPTQLRTFYDALHALKEQEQTALAELHAEDPARLIARFAHSVGTVARYPTLDEAFHGERPSEAWKEHAGESVTSTTTFVANLAAGGRHEVADHPELAFDFVDREVFPLRSTTTAVGARSVRRSIDLLLRDGDRLPVVGELKVAGDSPTYYALIQALMYAAELSGESQGRRLREHYDFDGSADGRIGIYIVAFAPPERGAFRERSFEASAKIAKKLMADPKVNRVLRRIAYLQASADAGGGLVFRSRFSY